MRSEFYARFVKKIDRMLTDFRSHLNCHKPFEQVKNHWNESNTISTKTQTIGIRYEEKNVEGVEIFDQPHQTTLNPTLSCVPAQQDHLDLLQSTHKPVG